MTRSKVVVALACIGIALAGCSSKEPEKPAPAPAAAPQASAPTVEVTATTLNIRETASPTGAVVGTLNRGDRARAPEAEAGGWLYVEVPAGPSRLRGFEIHPGRRRGRRPCARGRPRCGEPAGFG